MTEKISVVILNSKNTNLLARKILGLNSIEHICLTLDKLELFDRYITDNTYNDILSEKIEDCNYVLFITNDTPLIKAKTIKKLISEHIKGSNNVTFTDYENNKKLHNLFMISYEIIKNKPKLTIKEIIDKQSNINNIYIHTEKEFTKITDEMSYAEIVKSKQKYVNKIHMRNGVTIISPATTFIDFGVTIGKGTIINPNNIITGTTKIGENCVIGSNCKINNMIIHDTVDIDFSVCTDSEICSNTHVGPFAYIRPNSKIGENVKIGDFVEIKNSVIDNGTKVSHLTYIGDSDVGKNINFGCGTITVNYDGKNKFRTTIKDNAFIGCNSNLVAPVTIEENAFVAAGSTITKDVPKKALAIARSKQVVKENWTSPIEK